VVHPGPACQGGTITAASKFVLTLARRIHKVETFPGARPFLWGVSAGTIA